MTGDRWDERLDLPQQVIDELRAALPSVAQRTVAALTTEVVEYNRAGLSTEMAATIEQAVRTALATFLRMVTAGEFVDPRAPVAPALEAAYSLGRGEARSGRTMDALLAAYRVGARVAWREHSSLMVQRGIAAATVARYAELVFAYIDELSAASAAGHRDELATSGRVREQYLERLAVAMLEGSPAHELEVRAGRANWPTPESIAVVVLRSAHLRTALQLLDPRTLVLAHDVIATESNTESKNETSILLVPDAHRSRRALLQALQGRGAIVGPTRAWTEAYVSYRRALVAIDLLPAPGDEPLDTDDHLVTLVLGADRDALNDLRGRVLQPLAHLRPPTAERLAETLRCWLLHQGSREEVAAELHVHPQTVRYRMTQLRELFGDRLADPNRVLELTIALAGPDVPEATTERSEQG